MSRLLAFLAVALAVAVGIFALRGEPHESAADLPLNTDAAAQEDSSDAVSELASSGLRTPSVATAPEAVVAEATTAKEDAERPGVVLIEALDHATGEPLPHAPFHYYHSYKPHEGETDDQGLARVEGAAGSWVGRIQLSRTDDYAGSDRKSARLVAGEEKRVTLTSQAGGTLAGTVVTEDGTPVGGAEVRVWTSRYASRPADATAISEPDGSFSIPRVGDTFVAAARTETMACAVGLRGTLKPETQCKDLTLVVKPIGIFEGTVVDSDKNPIEGAHLLLSTGLNSNSSRDATAVPGITVFRRLGSADTPTQITEADGRFYFDNQPEGTIQVRVEATGFVGQWMTLKTSDSPTHLVLNRGLMMRGTVVLPDGTPAEGATVRYDPKPRNTRAVAGDQMDTGADGTFELAGLDPADRDDAHLTVELEGYAVAALRPPVFDSGQGESNLVQLEEAQALEGIVKDQSGTPVDGIRVVLDGGGRFESYDPVVDRIRSWESEAGVDAAVTDSEGLFAFQHRRKGPVALRVYPSDARDIWIDVDVAASEESVEVMLDPSLTRKVVLTGEARDASTGAAIPKLSFVIWRGDSGTSKPVETVNGSFELSGLLPGKIKIEARADGYAPLIVTEQDFAIGVHPIGPIVLTPAIDASVLVVDTNGDPWKEGSLQVLGESGDPLSFRKSVNMRGTTAFLNGNPLLLGELPNDLLSLRISAEGVSQDIPFRPGTVEAGEVTRITVEAPERAQRRDVHAILLRREALEDPNRFIAELEKAVASADQVWAQANMDKVQAAGPRSEVVILAIPEDGHPAKTTVTWSEETKQYSMKIESVTSASMGSSMSSSHTTELPVPFAPIEVASRGNDITLKVVVDGAVVLEKPMTIQASGEVHPVVLAY